jgi:hypothetical protein
MKASPLRERLDILEFKFLLRISVMLLLSSIESLMGLKKEYSAYSRSFILFFYEGSIDNFKI